MSQPQSMVLPVTYDDLKKITIPHAVPIEVVTMAEADGFILNTKFTSDFRIRKAVYEKLLKAREKLPAGWRFMIYEAYRPLQKQVGLWNKVIGVLKEKYPEASETEVLSLAETFVANPHDGIGSGHQACCAVDITLCDEKGNEVPMGTACQEFDPRANTYSPDISDESKKNRGILIDAMESVGLVNYPAEWWHFSYGDHQWAFLAGKSEALFEPIDI